MTDTPTTPPPRHSRKGLFAPVGIALIALTLWTGWWIFLVRTVETRLVERVEALREAGWDVQYADLNLSGWPFRVRAEARHVELVAPSGQAIAAPELAAEAMAWNPDRWVLVASDGLVLTRGDKGKVAVEARGIRASASGLRNPYPNLALELVDANFTAHPGAEPFPISAAERIEFYVRPHAEGRDGGRAVAQPDTAPIDAADVLFRLIEARGRREGPVEAMAQDQTLTLEVEGVVENARRLSGSDPAGVLAAWARSGGALSDVRGRLAAGRSEATFDSPRLVAGEDGRLEGRLTLTANRPGAAISGLTGQPAAERMPERDVALSVEFAEGRTRLGPFVLAPAPKLF
ncbi:DUF2125 domain-containing protein [Brevundimonas balnearis]|uniref:DUF2125 domain-containing protein n=1 Tax=Brevundimonas balnearis TaxID=1572858 RepID=A0ABV6R454_9CAUL